MKKKVKFERADAPKPTRIGDAKAFCFKAPIPVKLMRGAQVRVNLGIKCSHPIQLFAARGLAERGIELVNPGVRDADTNLEVVLAQVNTESVSLEQGETVVRGITLDNSDVSAEGE